MQDGIFQRQKIIGLKAVMSEAYLIPEEKKVVTFVINYSTPVCYVLSVCICTI